jgi:hypothetical protein
VVLQIARDVEGNTRMLALVSKLSPTDFRQELNELYVKASNIEPPKTKKRLHKSVLGILNNASLAGIDFEKMLILEEYTKTDASHIIERAYSLMDGVVKDKQEIRDLMIQQERKYRGRTSGLSI